MADISDAAQKNTPKSSILYDPKFRAVIYQVALVAAVGWLFWWLFSNAATNLASQSRGSGFNFLNNPSGFMIGFSLIPFERTSSYFTVYLVGILNTLLVASIGVVLATFLGFAMGIARLSRNFLIRTFATVYIEIMRNVPLLLQLIFWYFLALNALPRVRDSILVPGGIVINQRGISAPSPVLDDRFIWVAVVFVLAIIASVIWRRRAFKISEETGNRVPVWLPILGIMVIPTALAYFISGTQVSFNVPQVQGLSYRGGFTAPPELTALILGLVIYTAAFVAEIVRAGIQAVNYGQTEAAESLGLRDDDRLRLVVIPQAMRVIVPPLTSQYLNLTKNSSLGAAIGFPELVSVFMGTALNQSGRAVEIVILTMSVYLTFSIVTSLFMNWYNSRVALIER